MSAPQFRQFVDSNAIGTYNGQPFSALLGNSNTDWQKQIFQTAVSTDNNLNDRLHRQYPLPHLRRLSQPGRVS
jgi:hypothetical protein